MPTADPFERDLNAALHLLRRRAAIRTPEAVRDSVAAYMARGIRLDDVEQLADEAGVKSIVSYAWFTPRFEGLLRKRELEGTIEVGGQRDELREDGSSRSLQDLGPGFELRSTEGGTTNDEETPSHPGVTAVGGRLQLVDWHPRRRATL